MNQNKRNGNRFEQEFAELLSKHGFWAHVFQQNKSGQPADVIAACREWTGLIDCKVVSDLDGFPFSRAEENQRLAMKKYVGVTGNRCYFAIKLSDGSIWMFPYDYLIAMEEYDSRKRITDEEIRRGDCCKPVDDWIKIIKGGM